MRNKKGKIKKVILGKNINCSAIYGNLYILLLAVSISSVVSLISAYLFRREFKRDMLLEEEIGKRRERAERLKSKISIIFVAILATIVGAAIFLISWGATETFGQVLLDLINNWYFIAGMAGLLLSLLIGDRILYSRHPKWIYWIMPLMALIPGIIIVILFLIYSGIIPTLLRYYFKI